MSSKSSKPVEQTEDGPSSSVHTEVTVLGAMLLDGNAVQDATENLQVSDFTLDSHQKIYRAMLAVMQDGIKLDYITLMEELQRKKQLSSIGGPGYLAFLTEGIPRHPKVEDYVRIIKRKSLLRQTMSICQVGVDRAIDASEDPQTIISDIQGSLKSVMDMVHEKVSLESQVIHTIETIERQRSGEQKIFVPSSLEEITLTHGGYALGELTVIAARPKVGKSSLLRQEILHNCQQGTHCHLITPEMTAEQVIRLYAAWMAKIPFRRVRHADRLSNQDMDEIRAASRDIMRLPLLITDDAILTSADALAIARRSVRENGTKLTGLDYLQKLKYTGKPEHRHIAVTDAVVSWAQFAKSTNVATLMVSSITDSTKDLNKIPTKADLRQSGDIQYEASTVMIIHREWDEENREYMEDTSVIYDAARSDQAGVKKFNFDTDYVRLESKQKTLY